MSVMRITFVAASVIILLSACATHPAEPQIKTVTVNVPVMVPCIDPSSPPPPTYADSPAALKAAMDFAQRDGLVKGEWAKHHAREAYLEELRRVCTAVPALP